jgi:4-hydroxy-tetrahydrodipicolinate synthase
VPVVAGPRPDGLRTCIDYTRRAKTAGAAFVMISPPRMLKINSDAVAKHFHEVAAAVDIPIIVQDYPPISGYAMEASLLARIAREVPAARIVKLEDPPTPFKTSRILEQAKGLDSRSTGAWAVCFCSKNCWRCARRHDRLCLSDDPREDRQSVSRREAR